MNILSIHAGSRHRNGIYGAPFHVVLFDAHDHCAVLTVPRLLAGDIAFGSNSWRGDQYERPLRAAVERAAKSEAGR